ncbi:MAG: peptidylprolyl isomerase [Mariprofundaceae bacterium]
MQNKIKHLTLSGLLALACITLTPVELLSEETNMIVTEGKAVSLEYALSLEKGKVYETNKDGLPLVFIHGSHQIVPGLENALEGMKVGESRQVTVKPEDGYGQINQNAIIEVSKDQIPEGALDAGAPPLQARDPSGRMINMRVVEVRENTVMLDANHPLAGKTLYFDVKILAIKVAPANGSPLEKTELKHP